MLALTATPYLTVGYVNHVYLSLYLRIYVSRKYTFIIDCI